MINKILSIFFEKKPQSKKYFTVMRDKQTTLKKENEKDNNYLNLNLSNNKSYIIDINNRGKIYNALFSACSQR